MKNRKYLLPFLLPLLLATMTASLCMGSAGLSLKELYDGLSDPSSTAYRILLYARLPRMLGGVLGAKFAMRGGASRVRWMIFVVLGLLIVKTAWEFFA